MGRPADSDTDAVTVCYVLEPQSTNMRCDRCVYAERFPVSVRSIPGFPVLSLEFHSSMFATASPYLVERERFSKTSTSKTQVFGKKLSGTFG